MKRCKVCNSRKWKRMKSDLWYCFNCGNSWVDPTYHKTIFSKDYQIGHENPSNTMRNHEEFVRDNLQMSKGILGVDYHKNVYKFRILKDNPAVSIGPQVKNWKNSRKEILKRGKVTYVRTTKNIEISIDMRFIREVSRSEELKTREKDIRLLFSDYAKKFQSEFNIILDVDNPTPKWMEVKPLEGFHSPVQFFGEKVKCVYPNGITETIGADAPTSFANIMDNLAIETKADDIFSMLKQIAEHDLQSSQRENEFSLNIATHTKAIRTLSRNMSKFTKIIDKLDEGLTKLRKSKTKKLKSRRKKSINVLRSTKKTQREITAVDEEKSEAVLLTADELLRRL